MNDDSFFIVDAIDPLHGLFIKFICAVKLLEFIAGSFAITAITVTFVFNGIDNNSFPEIIFPVAALYTFNDDIVGAATIFVGVGDFVNEIVGCVRDMTVKLTGADLIVFLPSVTDVVKVYCPTQLKGPP